MFAIICTYSKILRFLSRFQERISHWNGSSKYLYLPEGKTGSYISKLLERHKIAQSNLLLLRCHDRKFVRETSFVAGWKQKDKRAGMNCPMANVLATDSPVVSSPLHFFVFRPTNRIIREMIQISRYLLAIVRDELLNVTSSINAWSFGDIFRARNVESCCRGKCSKIYQFRRRRKYLFETQNEK